MEIKKITKENFRKYGQILEGYDFAELLEEMKKTPAPTDDVIYVPSVE